MPPTTKSFDEADRPMAKQGDCLTDEQREVLHLLIAEKGTSPLIR